MKLILTIITVVILCSCAASREYTYSKNTAHIIDQCYKLKKTAFIFEGKCADLTGINNNSEFCNGIQYAGEGGFPEDWKSYISERESFDRGLFSKLLFEKQRTMIGVVKKGTNLTIKRLVHHAWGVDGLYWITRAELKHEEATIEVELPSMSRIHPEPLWFDASSNNIPKFDSKYLQPCS
jgi:hypothetical protein